MSCCHHCVIFMKEIEGAKAVLARNIGSRKSASVSALNNPYRSIPIKARYGIFNVFVFH